MINYEINGYKLITQIGKGGMAEVWYAENSLGKPATIKIMHQKFIGEAPIIARFEAEAKAINKLNHPNIRNVFDFGTYENRPFIVLEYLDGQDLSSYLKNNLKIDNKAIASWWNTCIDALQYTHRQNIVHGSLKPSNLFLTRDGDIKIVDFGIAKLRDDFMITTRQGIGTLAYMSPEQIKNDKDVTYATDYYSLGIIFLKILSNKPPFADTSSEFELMKQIVEGAIDTKGISEEWTYIIKNATHPIPDNRKLIPYGQEQQTPLNINPINQTKDIEPSKDELLENTQVEVKEQIIQSPQKKKKLLMYIISFLLILFIIICGWLTIVDENIKNLTFKNNIAKICKNGKYGYINKLGFEVVSCKYNYIDTFSDGLARAQYKSKYGFVNESGDEVIPFIYDYAKNFNENIALVEKNKKFGLISETGKQIIPIIYDQIDEFSNIPYEENIARVKKNGKYGYVNKNGEQIIQCIYDDADQIFFRFAQVKKNGKYGYINIDGKEIIPCIYEDVIASIWFVGENIGRVKKNGKHGYVNNSGEEIIPCIYEYADDVFSDDRATVMKNGKYFKINKKGECVEDCP
jgi:serine/threonine protein kinase